MKNLGERSVGLPNVVKGGAYPLLYENKKPPSITIGILFVVGSIKHHIFLRAS